MFIDRKDAAQRLATALEKYRDKNAVVLGIPRGGAVTAYYVARHLNAEFSLLVARKLGHPNNPEYAVGAIAEDGTIHLNPTALYEVAKEDIESEVATQKKEIRRRIQLLRNGEPLPVLKNRIVILVDDGIATGATMFAAIKMCRNQGAGKIVVAAPIAGLKMAARLRDEVDEVVILEVSEFFHAVSQAYLSFGQVSDEEALALLERWKQEKWRGHRPSTAPQIIDEP